MRITPDYASEKRVLVTGAGGFIGHHLVKRLVTDGWWVRGVDIKHPEFEQTHAQEFLLMDLRKWEAAAEATRDVGTVYALAANMGGIGFIETNKAEIVRDNTLINMHTIEASRLNQVRRLFFSSSACVYPAYRQGRTNCHALREEDAYPAEAEDGYGWEKLYMERVCRHYREEFGLETRVARFHNIYGPLGTFEGGREKAPAAICRKIAMASSSDEIEIWGDGAQTRSYCYIDDCVEGICRLVRSDFTEPLNIGSDRRISVLELVQIVARAAAKKIHTTHLLSNPQGVRGRNSDNTKIRQVLNWQPSTSLEEGMSITYSWIKAQLGKRSAKEIQTAGAKAIAAGRF